MSYFIFYHLKNRCIKDSAWNIDFKILVCSQFIDAMLVLTQNTIRVLTPASSYSYSNPLKNVQINYITEWFKPSWRQKNDLQGTKKINCYFLLSINLVLIPSIVPFHLFFSKVYLMKFPSQGQQFRIGFRYKL